MAAKPQIDRSDGETKTSFSDHCEKCGDTKVEKIIEPSSDFDERGWFNVAKFKCLVPKCRHEWVEKFRINQ